MLAARLRAAPRARRARAGRLQLIAPRRQIGERAGQFGKRFFRRGQRRIRRRDALVDADEPRVGFVRLGLERRLLGGEPLERRRGVGRQRPLALKVGRELLEPAVEFADALLGAGLLALQRFARDDQTLQRGGRLGFGLAQARAARRRPRPGGRSLRLLAGARRNDADGLVLGALGVGDLGAGADPAQMEQQRLGAAHLAGNIAVAHCLPRLGLQRRDLRGELADDVFDPRQIVLGGLEPQLGLMPAGMQPGNAGGLFEHAAALIGPRLDDLADAALMDQGGRTRTGRGVGEQHRRRRARALRGR